MASASKSILFPVFSQLHATAEAISQTDLTRLLSLRGRLKQLQEEIAAEEESLQTLLEAGADVESGLFTAYLKTTERRSVAWKQVCERELGEGFCTRVLAATKAEQYTHLVVEAN